MGKIIKTQYEKQFSINCFIENRCDLKRDDELPVSK